MADEFVKEEWAVRRSGQETLEQMAETSPTRLDNEQRKKLLEIAETCPVHRTLSKKLSFRSL
jgi:uncharacterized OsmC-like protein